MQKCVLQLLLLLLYTIHNSFYLDKLCSIMSVLL